MSTTTRRILTAKVLALVALGVAVLVSVVAHRRATAPVPAPGPTGSAPAG